MEEDLKIELFRKIIAKNDIPKELRKRKKDHITISLPKRNVTEIKQYTDKGWVLDKEFKLKQRLKKDKSHDVLFEDKVWSLFASLGFKFMNLNRNFEVPYDKSNLNLTQQIDVLAKDDESIIIVECKSTKDKNKKSDFKKELEAYKSKIHGIITSLRSLFPDEKLKFQFILATENYAISEKDAERLDSINGVHFDDEVVNYYFELIKQIGLATRYQLLGNLFKGQEIPEMDNEIPAIKGKMGGKTYYSFSIEPEKLLKIGYVLHRNKANVNLMPTYQRIIKKSRLKSIHNFIDKNKGYFPNSIIISIDSGRKKELDFDRANTQSSTSISKIGLLYLPKKYRSVFIIDGQHRLYGYANSIYKNTNTIPVVAFENLERTEQVKLFMQINENQKAVSKNLRNTLNADLLWTSDNYNEKLTALRSRIAIYLGESRNSALYNKISIGEDNKIITQQAFESSLKKCNFLGKVSKNKIEKLGSFYKGDIDSCYEKLSELLRLTFNYIKDSLTEIWEKPNNIIVINKGVFSIIKIESDIVDHLLDKNSIKDTNNPKVVFEESKTYLDEIINFFININTDTEKELRKTYGTPGDNKYWRTLQTVLSDSFGDFEPPGLEDFIKKEEKEYNTKTFEYIREIEQFFNKDFKEKLIEEYDNQWLKKGVPAQTLKKAHDIAFEKNLKVENEEDEVNDWDCLTIIAYRTIALKNWRPIFEKDYSRMMGDKKTGNKEDKTKWMVELEQIRNKTVHSYYVTEEEFSFVEDIYNWLIKIEN